MKPLILLFSVSFAVFFFSSSCALGSQSLADTFVRVNPAVVDIISIAVDKIAISDKETASVSIDNEGSGVLIDDEGTILTASHVVQTAEKVTIRFVDGTEVPASVIASANWGDVALLKLDRKVPLPEPAVLADSDKVRIGDQVFVIGSPLGLSHSLSVGYISSRFQTSAMLGSGTMEVFQTDAAMNPGNSGGPLFNMQGEVIGIASHIKTTSGGFMGLAFAVTTNQIRSLFEKVSSWSGIEGQVLSGRKARLLNLPQESGLLVERVAANSWGGKIGLQPSSVAATLDGEEIKLGGDIILKIGSLEVTNDADFAAKLTDYLQKEAKAGRAISLQVLRGGKIIQLAKE